jgi:hypothetical protein
MLAQASSLVREAQNTRAAGGGVGPRDPEVAIRADMMILRADLLRHAAAIAIIMRALRAQVNDTVLEQHLLQAAGDIPESDRQRVIRDVRDILGT